MTDAVDATDRAIRTSSTVAAGWRIQAIRLQALSGQTPNARAAFAKLMSDPGGERLVGSPQAAYVYLALDQQDEALHALDRAVHLRDPGVLWMGVDPRLDPLRAVPEFQSLLGAVGLR